MATEGGERSKGQGQRKVTRKEAGIDREAEAFPSVRGSKSMCFFFHLWLRVWREGIRVHVHGRLCIDGGVWNAVH